MAMPSVGIGRAWRRELSLLALWLGLWALTGMLIGHLAGAMLAGLSLYLLLHLGYTYKLHAWLLSGKHRPPPDGSGVWQEIFLEFYRINERSRKRKRRLKDIVAEFQASTAALPDAAVVLDRRTRIVWFNGAAATLLGLRSPRDLGQRIAYLLRSPQFSDYLINPGGREQVEIMTHGNATTLSLRLIPYGNGQRLLIARDVSQQRRLDAMRRDFVANASHELRTPLTVLRGYLEMMQDESDAPLAQWKKPLAEMAGQGARMSRILEDLLTLARIEAASGDTEHALVDVPSMLENLVAAIRQVDDGRRQIETDIDARLLIHGNAGELESVFGNLLDNAVKYTPAGGRIRLRWRMEGDHAIFEVSDTGIGIDARHIPRLTERFYRVDASRSRERGGTGLGLAIVKHGLEHHEAELRIESRAGAGSDFTCHFPHRRTTRREAA